MDLDYRCPHCKKKINDKDFLSFLISKRNKVESKIFISVIPEDYKYMVKGEYHPLEGDLVYFHCEHCKQQNNLKSDPSKVEIELWINEQIRYKIRFAAICGMKNTKILIDNDFEDYKLNKVDFIRKWINQSA